MNLLGRLQKGLLTLSLALLVAFFSIIKLPQVALSYTQSLIAPISRPQGEFLPAGHPRGEREPTTSDWPMYNYDPQGTRYNTKEHLLSPGNVGNLKVQWQFPTSGQVTGTPAVFNNRIYFGDFSGGFYSVDAQTGNQVWKAQVAASVTASALVTPQRIIFGDLAGFIYGLDPETGAVAWKIRPNNHPEAAIFGSGTIVGKHVAIGVASIEELTAASPNYPCCSSRGSVLLLNPTDGKVIWQTYTVSDDEVSNGSSGASVWSTPTYDEELGLIYVTTGNNFSTPTTNTSDAFIALDAKTGSIVWKNQRVPDDTWNYNYPISSEHPDSDFGDSPQIYRLRNGQKVVGAGEKNGFYFVLDAATGKLLNQKQFEPTSGEFGGLFADSAVARGVVYANGSNWPDSNALPIDGSVIAFTGDGKKELWRFSTPSSANISGVAVANGVVYFQSTQNGNLYALDAETGAQLGAFQIGGGTSGPAVSRGHVYIGTGPFALTDVLPGSVLAFTLD